MSEEAPIWTEVLDGLDGWTSILTLMVSSVGRLEVLEGPTGRRRLGGDRRALMPGVQVSQMARKRGATRSQICDWRRRLGRKLQAVSGEPGAWSVSRIPAAQAGNLPELASLANEEGWLKAIGTMVQIFCSPRPAVPQQVGSQSR